MAPRELIKQSGYTFATLTDNQRTMTRDYQVTVIPQTLIIDKNGKVVAHFIGIRSKNELRAVCKKPVWARTK